MSDCPDHSGVIAALAGVIDTVNAGSTGLPALSRLLDVTQAGLGAAGMSFTEYGPAGGRVVAATGAAEWAIGRPLDLSDPAVAALGAGPRTQDVPLGRLPGWLTDQLAGRGIHRVLYCRTELGPRAIGHVGAYFPDAAGHSGPQQHALIQLAAACAAQQYAKPASAPVWSDRGRVLTALPDVVEEGRREHDRELFIAVTSHELRTPVTVIKGYADTLTNHWGELDEAHRREALRAIGQRSAELARLVDRLLAAATDAGAVGGQPPVPFDLLDGLRAAVDELPAELRKRLIIQLPVDLPKALGDRASLATVLTELVTNADKYTDDNVHPVELTAGSDAQSVFFRVSDRGVGVRPEHVERAFDRFWQGESGDRRRYPGAGLGLFLVRRIVERQSGWVSLRPREGGGTVAEVRLPRGDVMLSGEA